MGDPTPADLRSRYRARLETELSDLRDASRASTGLRKPVELDQQAVGRLSRMDAMQQTGDGLGSRGAPPRPRQGAGGSVVQA